MRFLACFALLLSVLGAPALAQQAATPPAEAAADPASAKVDELIRILESESARAELIDRLRARREVPATVEAPAETEAPGLARQIAGYTRDVAESGTAAIAGLRRAGAEVRGALDRAQQAGDALAWGLANLALLALTLLVARYVLRRVARRLQASIATQVRKEGRGLMARGLGVVGAILMDALAIVGAWVGGYATSLSLLTGPVGSMSIDHALLLNAFLVVEMTKVVLRAIFARRQPEFRMVPMSDATAAYWYFWFARVADLIGYTFLFLAPLLAGYVGPVTAELPRYAAMIILVVVGIAVVLRNRKTVREGMARRAANGHSDPLSRAMAVLGRFWHIAAIAYLLTVFVVWLVNRDNALSFMLTATLQSIVAVVVGLLAISLISRLMHAGVRLPESTRERLPLLESRLHAVVPRVMQVVRTLALIGIVLAIAHVWGIIDLTSWTSSERGQQILAAVVSATLIVLVGYVIYLVVSSWVEYRLNPNFGSVPTIREKTLLALFRNAFTIALVVFVTMLALAQLGLDIGPLLAGAGVLGLAIGFGAQKFVEDIITGVFIQMENVMNEGDVVEAGGKSGVVERLTIRSVSIRSLDGTVHLVPFSSVGLVSNMMKGFSYHVAEIGVAYRENIAEVKDAMREAFDLLMETDAKDTILEPLDVHGVTSLGDSAVVVRARIKTLPGKQWAAGRAYNEFIKEVFDRRGIEIPFPHMTLYMGEDKTGKAPPLHLQLEQVPPAQGT